MFRKIIISFFVAIICTTAVAQPAKRSVNHNQDFALTRAIAISIPANEHNVKDEIAAVILDNGGTVEGDFFKRLLNSPKIILRSANQIAGARGDNALKIEVSYKKITITYTTELSLNRALELFKGQLAFRHGAPVIAGTDIIDWVDVDYTEKRHHSGALDLTSGTSLLPRSQIETIIGRTKRGDILEIAVITSNGWVIESSALEGINPAHKIYSSMGYYSLAHLKGLNDFAAARNIELVLRTDILRDNEQFKQTTGFAMNSVEGMRFVRALFTQWTAQTGITTFIIGKQVKVADERYEAFLDFLQKNLNIKFTRE